MGERTKVAVLGGGVGSVVAAFELTRPEYADQFEVTVYQLGWRLGGKGASGRDLAEGAGQRILEHGLHVWFGFYDEAWKAMRAAYDELGRDRDECPLATLEDAFTPCDQIVLYDRQGDKWHALPRDFPRNRLKPGESDGLPTLQEIAVALMRWVRDVFEPVRKAVMRLPLGDTLFAAAPEGSAIPDDVLQRARDIVNPAVDDPADDIALLLRAAELVAEPSTDERMLALAGDFLPLDWLVGLLRAARDEVWRRGKDAIEADPQVRVLFTMFDTAVSALSGIVEDDVLGDGFDEVNKLELCDWLEQHGAKPPTIGPTPETRAPILRSIYDVAFGYPGGDISQANVAAATAITDVIRLTFAYRGAVFYKMNAGMGDVVFAPFYEVLKQRGVRFEFFHAVTDVRLSDDGKRVTSIDVVRQAELKDPSREYEPLFDVPVAGGGTLPCWPAEPLWDQLADNTPRDSKFEDETGPPAGARRTLSPDAGDERDRFDAVVLGISVDPLKRICRDVYEKNEKFRTALDTASTVRTQAFQLWMNKSAEELGWRHKRDSVAGAYVEPLDTYCEMSHLLPVEHLPGTRAIAYFCGVQLESKGDDQEQATACAKEDALDFLRKDIGPLWPATVAPGTPGPLDWDLLVDPRDREGEERFKAQYWRANIAGSERYVLSPADTIAQRVSPRGFGVENLFPVGDWTRTGVDGGCVEAAAISGVRAAHSVMGDHDYEIPGEDPRWLRKK